MRLATLRADTIGKFRDSMFMDTVFKRFPWGHQRLFL